MGRPRQPIELVIANGKKHLTKSEIEDRRSKEVPTLTDSIEPPDYLTKTQKAEFNDISEKLQKLKIMSETDVDALARYILSRDVYISLSKKIRSPQVLNDPDLLDRYMKNQDRMFKQCRASANDLGLSISSRVKLVIPEINEPAKKENKFSKFEKVTALNG